MGRKTNLCADAEPGGKGNDVVDLVWVGRQDPGSVKALACMHSCMLISTLEI